MDKFHANSASNSLSRAMQLREAAVLTFCDPLPAEYTRLLHRSRKEWEDLLRWLDTSGLALYFLDRLEELGQVEMLPSPVLARLRQNLADNSVRIDGMITESVAIQRRFQEAGLSYAVLKGFSLWPISAPKLELRSQVDLDFLVAEDSAIEARRMLESFGYRLHVSDGRHLDFLSDEPRVSSLEELYKTGMVRSAELHIEAVCAGQPSILSRTQERFFHGVSMPVLSPIDLFLGQGLHLYKHICSQLLRTAHIIEFRRHVIARREDDVFWSKLQRQISGEQTACIRLGLVINLITHLMGRFAPEALTRFTADQLPARANLWVEMYGRRSALATFPGSKLYLLLEKELEAKGLPAKRSLWKALVPRRLPQSITHAVRGKTRFTRFERRRGQLFYVLFRLRFSALEGLRFFRALILWLQYRNGVS